MWILITLACLFAIGTALILYEIHNALARRCDPYVPFLTGMLANSGTSGVTPEGVHYAGPYARYQYYGVDFNHTIEYHPLATAMWDKAMMAAEGDSFIKEVEDIVKRRARQLYGR